MFSWKTTIVVSWTLAAGGTLACLAAIFDYAVPSGSTWWTLAALVPLGLAIAGIVVGFARVCDGCEEYFNGNVERKSASKDRDRIVIHMSEQRVYDYTLRKPGVFSDLPPVSPRSQAAGDAPDWPTPRRGGTPVAVKPHRGQ